MRIPPELILVALLLPAPILQANPIDCKTAASVRERAVCTNPGLLELDRKLMAIYDRLQVQLSPAAAAAMRSDQTSWLAWLDQVCGGQARPVQVCLGNEYHLRLTQLRAGTVAGPSPTVYTRAYFALVRNPDGKPSAAMDPGYVRASFAWPQIDRPTEQQDAWNRQVEAEIVQLADGSMPRMTDAIQKQIEAAKTAPFPSALNGILLGWDESSLVYSVDAANENLISITFHLWTYNYGAAHGLDDPLTFTWWLDRGRELQASDIFREGSGWKTALTQGSIRKLQADTRITALWKGDELRNGVTKEVANPRAWHVSQDGLSITFGEYGVSGYSAGEPSVHFTWQELELYVNPDLDISKLPVAIQQPAI